jgi:Domain of Unknown Function (DUF1080)
VKKALIVLLVLLIGTAAAFYLHGSVVTDRSDGWRPLFDGKSLAGWGALNGGAPGSGWQVQKRGVLTSVGHTGDLVTIAEFGDFELSFDWKVSQGANSGVFYRIGPGDLDAYQTAPEYQILDNQDAEDRHQPNHIAGSVYDLVAPSQDLTRPARQWNKARIVVRGWHIEHWLNGQKILQVDLADSNGKALIKNSKFANAENFARYSRGRIALQDHGDVVSFRNIRIRDF